MLHLDFSKAVQRTPVLENGVIVLRAPALADHAAWLSLRSESRGHLTRWEPDWTDKDVSFDAFRSRIRAQERLSRSGAAYSFFTCIKETGALIGGVTLSDVRYQASHSATLGYWIGGPYLRQGYGLASVRAVLDYSFGQLRLNRVEAACQPGNVASRALLGKAGFREEGLARDFLFINGAWRDHLLFALTARDFCGAPRSP